MSQLDETVTLHSVGPLFITRRSVWQRKLLKSVYILWRAVIKTQTGQDASEEESEFPRWRQRRCVKATEELLRWIINASYQTRTNSHLASSSYSCSCKSAIWQPNPLRVNYLGEAASRVARFRERAFASDLIISRHRVTAWEQLSEIHHYNRNWTSGPRPTTQPQPAIGHYDAVSTFLDDTGTGLCSYRVTGVDGSCA